MIESGSPVPIPITDESFELESPALVPTSKTESAPVPAVAPTTMSENGAHHKHGLELWATSIASVSQDLNLLGKL